MALLLAPDGYARKSPRGKRQKDQAMVKTSLLHSEDSRFDSARAHSLGGIVCSLYPPEGSPPICNICLDTRFDRQLRRSWGDRRAEALLDSPRAHSQNRRGAAAPLQFEGLLQARRIGLVDHKCFALVGAPDTPCFENVQMLRSSATKIANSAGVGGQESRRSTQIPRVHCFILFPQNSPW